ncbi:helix-turn-helix domain-containing protein [Candidatus Vondammii sp. HM_W22]|uniref:helix-turn-helix domain-containing protein n=1 Tax=Candidatus Vondammii sp. HM_W22 TaxID=2687299 RepID=UPI00403DCE9F
MLRVVDTNDTSYIICSMRRNWFDRAKECMKLAGVSQGTIAEALGCTRGAVGHYLSGRRNPTLSQFGNNCRLASA